MKWILGWTLSILLLGALSVWTPAHSEKPEMNKEKNARADADRSTHSTPGRNVWNQGREPQDWWREIERYHGHVGPWNVLGWRIGRAALRELDAQWGDHTLNIICHLPLATPYTCLADGLTVATGNSLGRLDIRLAAEPTTATLHVSIRKKTGGPTLEFRPNAQYLAVIASRPVSELEKLSRQTSKMREKDLFTIRRR